MSKTLEERKLWAIIALRMHFSGLVEAGMETGDARDWLEAELAGVERTVVCSEYARTLAILSRLVRGEKIALSDGHILAMDENMTLGYMLPGRFVRFPLFGLDQLNRLLNKHEIA